MTDRYDSNPAIRGIGYELYVMDLVRRVAKVQHEPSLGGKTPDLLVTDGEGRECIIECTTLSRSLECTHNPHAFTEDPSRLNERLYSSIEEKMRKYKKDVIGNRSYVVAIQNECCGLFDKSVQDVVMGAWRYRQGKWVNLWKGETYANGLFGLYPDCSGVLHSTWMDHLYFPNPRCKSPANIDLFPFASIVDPRPQPSGHVDVFRQATVHPKDASMRTIRGATIRGLPPGSILLSGVFKLVDVAEDGTHVVEFHGYDPSLLR